MRAWTLLFFCMFSCSPALLADEGHHHANTGAEKIGRVVFPVSCSTEAQKDFSRAVALLHSFWYEEAEKAFRAIAEKDPKCAMAHWGVAMTNFRPLWYAADPATREKMREELGRAEGLEPRTARERDYIAALFGYFRDPLRADHPALMVEYEQAMEKLHQRYPRDKEAAIFYALALLGTAQSQPPDKTYARQRKAGAILEPLFRAQPDHPGLAHYVIHAYDFPVLAEQGLDAARRYARIAPAVPHALRDQLRQSKVPFWTDQTEILHLSAAAWVAHAQGYGQEAERLMRASADLEDSTDKHPVTPGAITPAREMLGDLLMELKRPKEALAEYEASLQSAPRRFNGLYGAARAVELAADPATARTFYNQLLETCGEENTERKELDAARTFIAKR